MSGTTGEDTAERLSSVRPDMRVLYMSGYTDDAVVVHGVLDADVALLHLLRRVREVLDAPGAVAERPAASGTG